MKMLSKQELEKLTTKRLLAYKNKLMQVPEGPSFDEDNVDRMNKQNVEWQHAYFLVKEVLSTREHVI